MSNEEKQQEVSEIPTKFVVVTPVFNCEDSIVQTMLSVIAQSYDMWRMLVMDDMSTDKTAERAQGLVNVLGANDKITVTKNAIKHGEVRNTLEAAKQIEGDEVIVRVDGGDWLTDLDAFAMLDYVYRASNAGAVYSAQRWDFTNKNISAPLPSADADVYKIPWTMSHLKTWRRSAMDGINDANYRDATGEYAMIACDRFVYLPILENCKRKGLARLFIPRCFYHYSIDLADPELYTCDRSVKQKDNADWLAQRGFIE